LYQRSERVTGQSNRDLLALLDVSEARLDPALLDDQTVREVREEELGLMAAPQALISFCEDLNGRAQSVAHPMVWRCCTGEEPVVPVSRSSSSTVLYAATPYSSCVLSAPIQKCRSYESFSLSGVRL
jgi:hypothetical protein